MTFRSLVKVAAVASMITAGTYLAPTPASAAESCVTGQTGPGCPNPQETGPNSNNPNGGGVPASGADGPVCGNGKHVGNPHCQPTAGPGTGSTPTGSTAVLSGSTVRGDTTVQSGSTVRAAQTQVAKPNAAPRANKPAAPRANKAAPPQANRRVAARAARSL